MGDTSSLHADKNMRHFISKYILVILFNINGKTRANEFDFGLMESEPNLQSLFEESNIFLNKLSIISEKHSEKDLQYFVKTELNPNVTQITPELFVQHPI